MQNCTFCGSELPENARFCGRCGHVMDPPNDVNRAPVSNATPPPYAPGSIPGRPSTWYPPSGMMPAGTSPSQQRQDEERNNIPPWSPFYGPGMGVGSGQSYAPNAPMVQGTPQIGGVPSVSGTPASWGHFPEGQPFAQAGGAPVHAPSQAPSYPPVHSSNSYPGQQPPSLHYHQATQPPPMAPHSPTQEHHQHAQHAHHAASNLHHAGAVATKVAGGSALKTIIIVTSMVVVLAGGGAGVAAYLLNRPQPVISIISAYMVGNTLAGASGTVLHINGQKFSSNSTITFLLDGAPVPGGQSVTSDSNGSFKANLMITDAWKVGTHTLTARDASNYSTQKSVTVMVVSPGQANTPGPQGAPPDDSSFKMIAQIQGQYASGGQFSAQETEIVTGHPDPMGGTVCQTEDNGQPSVVTGFTFNTHIPYRETLTFSCTGTYKGGKIALTETIESDVFVFSLPGGASESCTLSSPQTFEQLNGSYTSQNTFSGTITYPTVPDSLYPCNGSYTFYNFHGGEKGTWTGQVTDLHS